jgi:hypothetical protein
MGVWTGDESGWAHPLVKMPIDTDWKEVSRLNLWRLTVMMTQSASFRLSSLLHLV